MKFFIQLERNIVLLVYKLTLNKRLSERLCEVLIARLKKTEAFTWADIARALSSQMVGEPQLANSIMQRYCGRSDHSTYDQLGDSKKYLSTSSSESDDSEFDIYLSEVEIKKLRKVFMRLFGRLQKTSGNRNPPSDEGPFDPQGNE